MDGGREGGAEEDRFALFILLRPLLSDAPVQEPRSQPEAPQSGMCPGGCDDSGIATRSPFSSTSGSAPPPHSMFDDGSSRSAAAPPGASAEALATPLVTCIGPHSLRTSCPLAHWSPYTLDISLLTLLMSFRSQFLFCLLNTFCGSSFPVLSSLSLYLYQFFLSFTHSLSFLPTPLTVPVVILLGSLPYQG